MKEIKKKCFLTLCIISLGFYVSGQITLARPANWATPVKGIAVDNFYQINDSIYRSGQPDSAGFDQLYKIGMKSVLNLREKHPDNSPAHSLPIQLFHVEMKAKDFSDAEIIEALRILKTSPKPIVVHCKLGSDRTGVVLAMYRIVFQHWTKEQARDELENGGFHFHQQYINIPAYIKTVDVEKIRHTVNQ